MCASLAVIRANLLMKSVEKCSQKSDERGKTKTPDIEGNYIVTNRSVTFSGKRVEYKNVKTGFMQKYQGVTDPE